MTTNDIWAAAELSDEWGANDLRWKLYRVPREAIDKGSDESDAYLLHGIDSGNVRRVEVLIDRAYGRWSLHDQESMPDCLTAADKTALELFAAHPAASLSRCDAAWLRRMMTLGFVRVGLSLD